MYVTYPEYQAMGGTLDLAGYTSRVHLAEAYLDHWTLNRLKNADVVADVKAQGHWDKVALAITYLVDHMDTIKASVESAAAGTTVTSFNNGVNSFSFGSGSVSTSAMTDAERSAYGYVCRILPVDLISADVDYNHAS